MLVHQRVHIVQLLDLGRFLLQLPLQKVQLLLLLNQTFSQSLHLPLYLLALFVRYQGLCLVLVPYAFVGNQFELEHFNLLFQRQSRARFPHQFLFYVGGLLDIEVLVLGFLVEFLLEPLDFPLHFHNFLVFFHDGLSKHKQFFPQVRIFLIHSSFAFFKSLHHGLLLTVFLLIQELDGLS